MGIFLRYFLKSFTAKGNLRPDVDFFGSNCCSAEVLHDIFFLSVMVKNLGRCYPALFITLLGF